MAGDCHTIAAEPRKQTVMSTDDRDDLALEIDRLAALAAAARSIGSEGLIYAYPSGARCDEADYVMAIIEVIQIEARRVSGIIRDFGTRAEQREAEA